MDLHLVFLGTSGATPTVDRGSPATLIARGGDRILVDCGEGTQRQLMRSVGLAHIDTILLTHLHGDHYLGLPGFLKTLSLAGREEPLQLFGPDGLYELLREVERIIGRPRFPFLVEEAKPGTVYEMPDYVVKAARTEHGMPGLAWCLEERTRVGMFHPERAIDLGITPGRDFGRLQRGEALTTADGRVVQPGDVMDEARPGRKIVVTGDTRPTEAVIQLSQGATVLVHDSTFSETERDRALETGHSTAKQAAEVALAAGARTLVLTHLSSRHNWKELRDEARRVFPGALLPRDLDVLTVPYPDKGSARLERV